jgi:hypothetical protein
MANPGVYPTIATGTNGGVYGATDGANILGLGNTGMNFIPELYAGQLLVKFYETSVLGAITNTDYEGDIRNQGDSVIIRTLPDINITAHKHGMELDYEYPQSSSLSLSIDKGQYYAFVTDDVDAAQTDIKSFISEFTQDAAYQLRNTIERDVLHNVIGDPASTNKGNSAGAGGDVDLGSSTNPVGLTKSNIVEKIIECGQVLDEQNVPEDGRYLLLPPKVVALLKQSDLKQAQLTGDSVSPLRNGQVGMVDRFTLYTTNNLKTDSAVTDTQGTSGSSDDVGGTAPANILFGHKAAVTFASQLTKSESMVNPRGFGVLHRGLQVYGYKTVKSDAFGNLYAYVV